MYCPFCGHVETKVTDSRLAGEGRQIRRRRECLSCGERFTTFETAELVMPMVVKGDRSRETFDEAKVRAGMEKALEKRPVPREQLDEALSRITHRVRSLGDREVQSRAIGELVMDELRQLDEVAYVRFASVYRHFEDVEAFHEEIQRLRSQRGRDGRRGAKREPGREASRDQLSLLPVESAAKGTGTASGADSEPSVRSDLAGRTEGAENESATGVPVAPETKQGSHS
jgi:transcriptional repressor NrdR